MIAILFLFFVLLHGLVIADFVVTNNRLVKLAASFLLGSLACVTCVYLLSCLTKSLDLSLVLFFFFSIQLPLVFKQKYIKTVRELENIHWKVWLVLGGVFLFSCYLFFKSLGYDAVHGDFLIASHLYVDMGAHIPFIRSFSLGNNFSFSVPFFAEKSIFYYPAFDFYAGLLEKYGIRIDIAYNLLGASTLTSFVLLLYFTTYKLFKNKAIALLTIFLFFFPATVQTPNIHILSLKAIVQNLWHASSYNTSGPLGDNTIQVFWYFNTYLNQRPFLFGITSLLLSIYILFEQDKKIPTHFLQIILGIFLGFLSLWHTFVYLTSFAFLASLALQSKRITKYIFFFLSSLGIGISTVVLLDKFPIIFRPGYVLWNSLSWQNVGLFWLWNLGIGILLIPLGFILARREVKIFFIVPFLLFFAANLFQLAPFMYDNHKFFSVWIVFANMLSALAIATIWNKGNIGKVAACICILLCLLSGISNILVIKNDVYARITDYPHNKLMTFAKNNLPTNQTIFTNGEIYDPLSLIGKKTYLGRVHFIYTYGVSPDSAIRSSATALQGTNKNYILNLFKRMHMRYAVFYKENFAHNSSAVNRGFYDSNFQKIYEDADGVIYKI